MQKYLFILSITLSLGSYAISMKNVTQAELIELMKKSSIHNREHHHNNENCTKKCDKKRTKILLEIREIIKQINKKMLDRKVGNKKIKEIKKYWNDEHPSYQIHSHKKEK